MIHSIKLRILKYFQYLLQCNYETKDFFVQSYIFFLKQINQ